MKKMLRRIGTRAADALWKGVAFGLQYWPGAVDAILRYSTREPYWHLQGYMNRNWVFNPYDKDNVTRYSWTRVSARTHHILRADIDRHLHSHPWNARTIILRGWYKEVRLDAHGNEVMFTRRAGDTSRLNHGEYHRIVEVSEGGVWTLFFTFGNLGPWGFLVDGKKINSDDYFRADFESDGTSQAA